MKLVVADPLPTSAIEILKAIPGSTVDARTGRTADQLAPDLADAEALIVRSATTVDRSLIERAPRLRVIARAGTGVDNVDVEAATERGILVMNAPGANSVSVAELTVALMLTLSRGIAVADASMKGGVWDKKKLTGIELRGKTLGILGLGRIGQEVAARIRPFGMTVIAHDPFLSPQVADRLGIRLLPLRAVCEEADYITLHLPAVAETRHLINRETLASCKPGIRIVNTARGELIDESALADAIESGAVAGAALDVFEHEPPKEWRLVKLRQVVATPHIAASTTEAQELVGTETAAAVRDFLTTGAISNAVNFASVRGEEAARLEPYRRLAERMGAMLAQIAAAPIQSISMRYYGSLLTDHANLISSAAIAGILRPALSSGVSVINARSVAASRGIEIVESISSRVRAHTNVLSVKVLTSSGEHWIEGTVFEPGVPRLVSMDGVAIDAPLDGTLVIIWNDDQPGVIGDVGTILGRNNINIATFTLGRGQGGAVGLVNVDAADGPLTTAVDELNALRTLRRVCVVRA